MITIKELKGRPTKVPDEHLTNLYMLMAKLNKLREAYGKPLRVTSGYRTLEHHLEIYRLNGITDHSKIPMKSNHLVGLAADLSTIDDPIEHLHDWINQNIKLMEEIGIWMEAFEYTPMWAHCQAVPPRSGKRFCKP